MGKYKFKLSDMIPNAWFYKLKDSSSSRTRNQNITHPTKKKHPQMSSSLSYSSSSLTVAQPLQSEMQQADLSDQRKSYHFSREKTAAPNQDTFYNNLSTKLRALDSVFPEPPRKSSKKRRSTKRNRLISNGQSPKLVTSCVSAGCNCRATLESVWTKPDSTTDDYTDSAPDSSSEHESLDRALIPDTFDGMLSLSTSCQCRVDSDFIIDMENKPFNTKIDEPHNQDGSYIVSKLDLPPIITKPGKFLDTGKDSNRKEANEPTKTKRSSAKFEERNAYGSFSVKVVKEEIVKTSPKQPKPNPLLRRSSVHSPGVKLRTNTPRIASRRVQGRKSESSSSSSGSRKDLSESFAVVKSSKDPQKDFKESMVEMIVENNIFASKDLEDLLACYLSLNSDEYHDLIIKVFKQIWLDIIDPKLK